MASPFALDNHYRDLSLHLIDNLIGLPEITLPIIRKWLEDSNEDYSKIHEAFSPELWASLRDPSIPFNRPDEERYLIGLYMTLSKYSEKVFYLESYAHIQMLPYSSSKGVTVLRRPITWQVKGTLKQYRELTVNTIHREGTTYIQLPKAHGIQIEIPISDLKIIQDFLGSYYGTY